MTSLLLALIWLSFTPTVPSSGPALAVEDTMRTELPPVLVAAPRITLDEILERISRGERHRDSLIVDESFVATFRVVRRDDRSGESQLVSETVAQVYKKRPNKVRSFVIRRHETSHDEKNIEITFRPDMSEEIVNFAFRPEARRQFKYQIIGRDVIGDHLIYRILFEPKSHLDPSLPMGTVWVDTRDYVIVRQEITFLRSPVPILIKGMDRMVIERERIGEHWVLRGVLMRARATLPLPKVGREFDVTLQCTDYGVNRGLDDALFSASR
jgi:hypothetical protein